MTDYKDPFRISELLARLAAGSLTADENAALDAWKRVSAENARLYEKWAVRSSIQSEYKAYNAIDTANVRVDMRQRIALGKKAARRRLAMRLSIAAAVVAAAIVTVNVVRFPADGTRPEIKRLSNDVPTLLFDDGREMTIDDAMIVTKDGRMLLSHADGTSETVAVNGDSVPTYITLNLPRGFAGYNILLEDGTRAWLNADSRLRYPVSFGIDSREVALSGEAYFEVAKDGTRPFRVIVDGQSLEVLGTEFNVAAHYGSSEVQTTLVSGSVRLTAAESGASLLLEPGRQATLENGSGTFSVREVDTSLFTSWKDGVMVIGDRTLEQVLSMLETAYDVRFSIVDPQARGIVFMGRIPRYDDLWDVLDILGETSGRKFVLKGGTIYVE